MIYGPVDGEMTDLKYDCRNRLVKAGKISYEYDAEGNRTATVTDTNILMEMASIFVLGGIFVKAGYEILKGNGVQAIKDLAYNLVTGEVVGVVAGLVVKGGAKSLGAIGRTIKNSKPGKGLANTFQKAPKIFNGKNADKVDDFARGLSRNTNKVADDVAEGVVKKSNKTDDVASKVGKGRKTGQGSIVPTVDRGNRTPRPKNYSYGVDDAIKSGKKTNPNALKYNGDGTWTSNEGLIYGQGSREGNRVKHVLEHTKPNPNKPVHTVFNVDKSNVIGLVDEAWTKKELVR